MLGRGICTTKKIKHCLLIGNGQSVTDIKLQQTGFRENWDCLEGEVSGWIMVKKPHPEDELSRHSNRTDMLRFTAKWDS